MKTLIQSSQSNGRHASGPRQLWRWLLAILYCGSAWSVTPRAWAAIITNPISAYYTGVGAVSTNDYIPTEATNAAAGAGQWNLKARSLQKIVTDLPGLFSSPIHIDPRWFGASANGVTDDSLAFSNALVALALKGGSLYVPPNIKLTWQFNWPPPGVALGGTGFYELWGDPSQSLVTFAPAAGAAGTFLTISNFLNLRNLNVVAGGAATSGTWNCFNYTNSSPHVIVHNLHIQNFSGTAITSEYCDTTDWSGIESDTCGQAFNFGGFMDGMDFKVTTYGGVGNIDWDTGKGVSGGTGSPGNTRQVGERIRATSELAKTFLCLRNGALNVWDVSTYSEQYTRAMLDVGHDPAVYGADSSQSGTIYWHDSYAQGGSFPAQFCRIFTNPTSLTLSRIVNDNNTSTNALVFFTNNVPAFPLALENIAGQPGLIRFHNGDYLQGDVSHRYYWDEPFVWGNVATTSNRMVSVNNNGYWLGFSNETGGLKFGGFSKDGILMIQQTPTIFTRQGQAPGITINQDIGPATNAFQIMDNAGNVAYTVRGDASVGISNVFAGNRVIGVDPASGAWYFEKSAGAPMRFVDPSTASGTESFEFWGMASAAANIINVKNSAGKPQVWVDSGYNLGTSNAVLATTGYVDYANNGAGAAIITGTNIVATPFAWTNTFGPTFVLKIACTTTTDILSYTNNGVRVGLGPYTNCIITEICSTNDSLGFAYTGTAPTFTLKKL